jgi:predicted transcriptional regulator
MKEQLTKAEEQLMQYVWRLKQAYLKDIVAEYPDPKPAYTTISTVVRVLVRKGFLNFESFGKVRRYAPTLTKEQYYGGQLKHMIGNFFDGSSSRFALYFAENESLKLDELEEMKALIEAKIKKLKQHD